MTIGSDSLATDTFTGADGASLNAQWTARSGSTWHVQTNAAKPDAGSAPYTIVANPTRANDNYAVSFTIPGYPGASRPNNGVLLRRTNGTGTTNTGYFIGCDDSSNAFIAKIINDVVQTPLVGPTYKGGGGWLTGTLTASVDGSTLTLASSIDGTTITVTDSTYASGDVGFYVDGTGVSFDNFSMVGTLSGSISSKPNLLLLGIG
jgi:hypothetical protein